MLDSIRVKSEDSSRNDPVKVVEQSMTESPSERRIDRKAEAGVSPSPAKRRVKGIKFVN